MIPMSAAEIATGQCLGHFRVLDCLGAGGMGVVYRARDEQLERDVAIKVLYRTFGEESLRKRLRKEALALSRLNHPNIETIYSFESAGDVDFLVFELISGTTLAKHIKGPLDDPQIVHLGIQIAGAVAAAHQRGVIHRDLKPENIFVTEEGDAKVLDFGLAKVVAHQGTDATQSMDQQSGLVGTLPYMAPEQFNLGVDDERSDVYGLGAVLYNMATGQRLFAYAGGSRLIEAILHENPTPPRNLNPKLTPELERVILKCLDKDPNARYQSAREIAISLKQMLPQGASAVLDSRVIPAPRRRILWPILIALLALVVAASFLLWTKLGTRASPVTVVVTDFDNRTGEPVFDETPRELMTTALDESQQIAVFPSSRLPDVLRRMQRPETVVIDEDIGREICIREGLRSVVTGSITRLGSAYLVLARALNCKGELIVSAQKEFSRPEELPAAIEDITQDIRHKWGESRTAIQQASQPLALATSGSLEALKLYSSGKQQLYLGNFRPAASLFKKAVELDSGFAMAHQYLGIAYENLGDNDRAGEEYAKAAKLSGRVTEREREKILGDFALFKYDNAEAISHYQVLAALSPDDPAVHVNLAECYRNQFRFDAAIAEAKRAVELNPSPAPRDNLATYYYLSGDSKRAVEMAEEILRDHPEDWRALYLIGSANLAQGKPVEADHMWRQMLSLGGDATSLARAAMADAAQARDSLQEAIGYLEDGVIADAETSNVYEFSRKQILLAELHRAAGDRQGLERSLKKVQDPAAPDLIFLLGTVYARSGRIADAERQLHRLDQSAEKTPRVISFSNMLQSEIASAQGHFPAAVRAAEMGADHLNSAWAVGTLARAYDLAGEREAAVHQYELLLSRANERQFYGADSPALHAVAEARYRLGVLYQSLEQHELAKKQFEAFLSYASDTDKTGPIYEDVRKRMNQVTLKSPVPADPPLPRTAPLH